MVGQHKHSDSRHDGFEQNRVSHRPEDNPLHADVYHPRAPIAYKLDEASRRANGEVMRGMTAAEEKASINILDNAIKKGELTEADKRDILYYKDHNLSRKEIRKLGEDMAFDGLDDKDVRQVLRRALQDGRITEKDWDDIVKVFDKYKQQEA